MEKTLLYCLVAALVCFASPALTEDSPEAATEDVPVPKSREYLIGVEDVLRIVTWGEPELTLDVKVRPDGKISMPLINEVTVVGLTPAQVRERIAEKMEEFIHGPNVTVMVQEINSFRVFFLGEVVTQGPQLFYQPTRLLQGLATAGGLTEFSKKEISVIREEYGVEKRIEINYKQIWSGSPGEGNIWLRPGDTVLCK